MKKREEMTPEEIAFVEESTVYQILVEDCGDSPEVAFDRANETLCEFEEAYWEERRRSEEEKLERSIMGFRDSKLKCGYSREWLDNKIAALVEDYRQDTKLWERAVWKKHNKKKWYK